MGFTVHHDAEAAAPQAAGLQPAQQSSRGLLGCVGLLFVLMGLGGGFWAISDYQLGQRSAAWPMVMGTITRSEVVLFRVTQSKPPGNRYRPEIEYTFEVDRTRFTGSDIKFGSTASFLAESSAHKIVDRYPVGSTVPIAYDPKQPAKYHVLEPGADAARSSLIAMSLAGGIFMLLGSWLVIAAIRITARQR